MRKTTDDSLFATIVGQLSEGIYVIKKNRTVFINQRAADIFGYSCIDSLIGQDMFKDVYPDRQSVELFRNIHSQIRTGNPPRISWGQPCTKVDGTPFWLEVEARLIEVAGQPAILGTFHDHTDCKLLGEAMHASQSTLRLLLDAMEDRVYVVTDEYRMVYANRKMLDNVCGDIASDFCYKVCRGLETRCTDCSIEKIFISDKPVQREFYNELTRKWFSVIELPIRMPGVSRPTKLAVARDITSRKEAENKIRALSHRLFSMQENERKHLSRELHDDLGQRLNAAKIVADLLAEDLASTEGDVAERITRLSRILHAGVESVRHISAGLRPASLERLGLVGAIRNDCAELSALHGFKMEFKCPGMKAVQLGHEVEINLYRIFQEALHNVVKHAGATEVKIHLVASHPVIRMRIKDNGKGFFGEAVKLQGDDHLGLVGMAERADLLNGTFEIISRPGEGTRIALEIPIG